MEAVAQRCSVRKGVLRNFTKFTGKHLCQSLFFNKVAGRGCFLIYLYLYIYRVFFLRRMGSLKIICNQF